MLNAILGRVLVLQELAVRSPAWAPTSSPFSTQLFRISWRLIRCPVPFLEKGGAAWGQPSMAIAVRNAMPSLRSEELAPALTAGCLPGPTPR